LTPRPFLTARWSNLVLLTFEAPEDLVRAQLEIAVAEAQRDPSYRRLGLPQLKIGARVPTDVLEHLVAVATELKIDPRRRSGVATRW